MFVQRLTRRNGEGEDRPLFRPELSEAMKRQHAEKKANGLVNANL